MADSFSQRPTYCSRRDFLGVVCRGTTAFTLLGAAERFCRAAVNGGTARRNIIFILSDDHRYDFMGFMEQAPAFLETPAMDRMARHGAKK